MVIRFIAHLLVDAADASTAAVFLSFSFIPGPFGNQLKTNYNNNIDDDVNDDANDDDDKRRRIMNTNKQMEE